MMAPLFYRIGAIFYRLGENLSARENRLPVVVYTKPACQQCDATKRWLKQHAIRFTQHDLSEDEETLEKIKSMGYQGAPVVIVPFDHPAIPGHHWYGFNPVELSKLLLEGPAVD